MATGGNASVEAERDMLLEGMVENESERFSVKVGMEAAREEMWGEAGAEVGPDEANIKKFPHAV
jgi:hypothetical protein